MDSAPAQEIGERKEHDIINVLTIFLQNEATKKAAAWLQHRHLAAVWPRKALNCPSDS